MKVTKMGLARKHWWMTGGLITAGLVILSWMIIVGYSKPEMNPPPAVAPTPPSPSLETAELASPVQVPATEKPRIQVMFSAPAGAQVSLEATLLATDHASSQSSEPPTLVIPGRQEFAQAGLYRLKISSFSSSEDVELYPTLETGQSVPRTQAEFAHNSVEVQFTEEDQGQLSAGSHVTKVFYLVDPEFRKQADDPVATIVSTHLPEGVDPILEADRRGSIMAILRMGPNEMVTNGEQEYHAK